MASKVLESLVLHCLLLPSFIIPSYSLFVSHIDLSARLCTPQAWSCLRAFVNAVSSTWNNFSDSLASSLALCPYLRITCLRDFPQNPIFNCNSLYSLTSYSALFFFIALVTVYNFPFTPYSQVLSTVCFSTMFRTTVFTCMVVTWLQANLVFQLNGREKWMRTPMNTHYFNYVPLKRN